MTYGMPAPPARVKPPISGVDLGISITAMMLTAAFVAFATFIGVFLLVFVNSCPPGTCSVDGAITAVGATVLIALGIGVAGLVATIVQLVRRGRAWPFAVGTFVLCVVTCVIGVYAFGAAAGVDERWLFG